MALRGSPLILIFGGGPSLFGGHCSAPRRGPALGPSLRLLRSFLLWSLETVITISYLVPWLLGTFPGLVRSLAATISYLVPWLLGTFPGLGLCWVTLFL